MNDARIDRIDAHVIERVPRVLLLRPDSRLPGGVVNYYNAVLHLMTDEVEVRSFIIGRRPGILGSRYLYPLRFLLDCVQFVILLLFRRFDVIHLNPSLNAAAFYRDVVFLALAKALSRAKILVFFRGWEDDFFERLLSRPATRRLFLWFCRRADRLLVLASSIRDQLIALGVPDSRVDVTNTTFDGTVLAAAEAGEKNPRFTFLFMSRLLRQKGVGELIESVKMLVERGHDFGLIIAGSGPFEAEAREKVRAEGLEAVIDMPGYLRGPAKGQAFASADAFVFPTYHGEGCPNCILEAMGAGLPVISTTVGGIPDLIDSPRGGLLLKAVTPPLIADAMEAILTEPDAWASVGAENRERAWARYEAGSVARYLESVYRTLAGSTQP